MMFSTKAEYGVRVMISLGRRHGQGPTSLAEIAESEVLPLGYLEHLVAGLRKAGLVRSTRGAHGGYELGRQASKITMAEVVNALGTAYGVGSEALVSYRDDPKLRAQFASYPPLECPDSLAAGFRNDGSVESMVRRALET